MNVLLLTQPAGQTILVDTRERICLLVADNKLISQYSVLTLNEQLKKTVQRD